MCGMMNFRLVCGICLTTCGRGIAVGGIFHLRRDVLLGMCGTLTLRLVGGTGYISRKKGIAVGGISLLL